VVYILARLLPSGLSLWHGADDYDNPGRLNDDNGGRLNDDNPGRLNDDNGRRLNDDNGGRLDDDNGRLDDDYPIPKCVCVYRLRLGI
jgi:hypothetical protein